jgi:hypothetical protein
MNRVGVGLAVALRPVVPPRRERAADHRHVWARLLHRRVGGLEQLEVGRRGRIRAAGPNCGIQKSFEFGSFPRLM